MVPFSPRRTWLVGGAAAPREARAIERAQPVALVRRTVVALLALATLPFCGAPVAHSQEIGGTGCADQAVNDSVVRDSFSPLFRHLGDTAGTPVGCIRESPDGGTLQPTTKGLLYARPEGGGPVRIIVFTDGYRHWAIDGNLREVVLYWEGDSPYPPSAGVSRIPLAERPGPASVSPSAAAPSAPAPQSAPPVPAPSGPARIVAAPVRPPTGEHLAAPSYQGGYGTLTISNEAPWDAAFKLRDADGARGTRAFVFLRSHEQTRLEGIGPGMYHVQFIMGTAWDAEARTFRQGLAAFRAEQDLEFVETLTAEGISYVQWTLTLFRTAGGNIAINPIDLSEFQRD